MKSKKRKIAVLIFTAAFLVILAVLIVSIVKTNVYSFWSHGDQKRRRFAMKSVNGGNRNICGLRFRCPYGILHIISGKQS